MDHAMRDYHAFGPPRCARRIHQHTLVLKSLRHALQDGRILCGYCVLKRTIATVAIGCNPVPHFWGINRFNQIRQRCIEEGH